MFATLFIGLAVADDASAFKLDPTGEVRFDLVGDHLEQLQSGASSEPDLYFLLERGFIGTNIQYGDALRARVLADISQSTATTVLPGGSTGPQFPSTTRVRVMDAWLEVDSGVGQWRIGQQFAAFGNVDHYMANRDLYVPGPRAFLDAPRRMGLLPDRVQGVTWRNQWGRLGASAQVFGLYGAHALEQDIGKAAAVRVSYGLPQPGLRFSASALAGPGTGAATRVLWDAQAGWDLGRNHALIEVFGGQGLGARELAAVSAFGHDIPLSAQRLDRLGLTAKLSWFEPDLDSSDDWNLLIDGAAKLWLGDLPQGHIMFGLGWQTRVPENVDLAIEHRAVLQALWGF